MYVNVFANVCTCMSMYTKMQTCTCMCLCVCGCVRVHRLYSHFLQYIVCRVAKTHMIFKLQVFFRKRATNYRALLQKMTCEDKASYGSSPFSSKLTLCSTFMTFCSTFIIASYAVHSWLYAVRSWLFAVHSWLDAVHSLYRADVMHFIHDYIQYFMWYIRGIM